MMIKSDLSTSANADTGASSAPGTADVKDSSDAAVASVAADPGDDGDTGAASNNNIHNHGVSGAGGVEPSPQHLLAPSPPVLNSHSDGAAGDGGIGPTSLLAVVNPTLANHRHQQQPAAYLTSSSSFSPASSHSSRLSRKKAKKQKNHGAGGPFSINPKSKRNSFLSLSSFHAVAANQQQQHEPSQLQTASNTAAASEPSPSGDSMNVLEPSAAVSADELLSGIDSFANMENSDIPRGITQRTVIIHKDSRGYGMRISGDNPVFIQHVNEDGAAYKAGVRFGDHIIKVNGTLVTRLGHTDVVKMIQNCGSFVGLTLRSSQVPQTVAAGSPGTSPTPTVATAVSPLPGVGPVPPVFPGGTKRITGPQPVPESTQQQFQEKHIRTLQTMINKEMVFLEELLLTRGQSVETERCQKRINDMKAKLEMMQQSLAGTLASGHHHRQASWDLAPTVTCSNEPHLPSSTHRIMPMDEDVDLEDTTYHQPYECIEDVAELLSGGDHADPVGRPALQKSISDVAPSRIDRAKRNSCSMASIPEDRNASRDLQNIHQNSFQLAHYLLQHKVVAPNELLFYVMARTVFPQMVAGVSHHRSPTIQRWAYQIIATWITKESPLFMREFPQDYLERFDHDLTVLVGEGGALAAAESLFEPFWLLVQDLVRQQWNEYQMHVGGSQRQNGLKFDHKTDLLSCVRMLLSTHSQIGSMSPGQAVQANAPSTLSNLRDVDHILDTFVPVVKHQQCETALATISCLLAIGRYLFNLNPFKHSLLLDLPGGSGGGSGPLTAIALNTIADPLLKLSSESSHSKKSGYKRHSMIGASRSPAGYESGAAGASGAKNGNVDDRSHCFVPIFEMSHIIFCTLCYSPVWGDPYALKCTKCLMCSHQWCRKGAAAANICNDHRESSSVGSTQHTNKQTKLKKSVFEKFGKRVSKLTDPSPGTPARSSSGSSSSSSDSDGSSTSSILDLEWTTTTASSSSAVKPDEELSFAACTEPASVNYHQADGKPNDDVVNRSDSFVQRKKKKPSTSAGSPRKRSDPALTSKQISIMSSLAAGPGTVPGTSAISAAGTLAQLSSARSSGTLVNSASVGAHDSQFRPLTGHRAKHLTASDSSLMSTGKVAGPASVGSMLFGEPGDKSSSTNLSSSSPRRAKQHRNTNDSAIQMDGSSEDETGGDTDVVSGDKPPSSPPPPPPSPPPPPPLPPRLDSQMEKRRQIQMEIVQTEEEHYEVLRYIRRIYQKPLRKEKLFSQEHIDAIFGNIKDLKRIHHAILKRLAAGHKQSMMQPDSYQLEEAIYDIFCGELGTKLEQAVSLFCVNRKIKNGTELWNQRKKDPRLKWLNDSETRSRSMPENHLARFELADLLSRVFQRPLRYPLLFERLLRSTPKDSAGYRHMEQAFLSCRKSGEVINEATRRAELRARLKELLRKTDFSGFPNAATLIETLEQQELLHEGPLMWRITKQKLVDVLLMLTDQILLVLSRESNDRYVLKSHSNPTTKIGNRPDIKMDDLLMRDVATDQTAFFLVSKDQDIIYEFAAPTASERNKWKEVITKAIQEYRAGNRSPIQSHKSFMSSRSSMIGEVKTPEAQECSAPPSLPPPSIVNRPLPKPPSESPPPPPPPPPAPGSSFMNRPLPKPPVEASAPPPPPRCDSSIQPVTERDCHPSTVDLVPFSQVRINPQPRVKTSSGTIHGRFSSTDMGEIRDNLQNLLQERLSCPFEELEREFQEMSMVYDVAKHDPGSSKEIVPRLITDMFRKACEWSYMLVRHDEPAKQELSHRVRNAVESFVKCHIDSNFILPLPGDQAEPGEMLLEQPVELEQAPQHQEPGPETTAAPEQDASGGGESSASPNPFDEQLPQSPSPPSLSSNPFLERTTDEAASTETPAGNSNSEEATSVPTCQTYLI